MSENVIKTIHKLRVTTGGEWIEFWFKEDFKSSKSHHTEMERFCIDENFHASMKTYMFLEELKKEGIYSDVLMDGLKRMKTVWKRNKFNTHWEFVSFLKYTRIVLVEKIN